MTDVPGDPSVVEVDAASSAKSPPSLWLSYLRLLRLPLLFSALADVLLGAFLVQDGEFPLVATTFLLATSACLYMAGMVLNDVYDVEIDAVERPERPLPSGRISVVSAARIGWLLIAAGMLFSGMASIYVEEPRPLFVAMFLATMIFLYDGALKQTMLGPLAMGACRSLNVLLGLSALRLDWRVDQLMIAVGLGVYIAGVTVFAKREAERSRSGDLLFGLVVMMAGVLLAACHVIYLPQHAHGFGQLFPTWYILMLFLAAMVARRCLAAMSDPGPQTVQRAVKHALMTYVMFDAALVLPAAGVTAAALILLLLLPALLLGRWIYAT